MEAAAAAFSALRLHRSALQALADKAPALGPLPPFLYRLRRLPEVRDGDLLAGLDVPRRADRHDAWFAAGVPDGVGFARVVDPAERQEQAVTNVSYFSCSYSDWLLGR